MSEEMKSRSSVALNSARDAKSSVGGSWLPIRTAPAETFVLVLTERRRAFKAKFGLGAAECDAWFVDDGDPHPDCWTDGTCWASNADEEPSDHPTHWMPLPPQPRDQQVAGASSREAKTP